MARPDTEWTAANFIFKAPAGRDDVIDLPVFKNDVYTVSRWQLSDDERADIFASGRVYLAIMGSAMPPVFLGDQDEVRALVAEDGIFARDDEDLPTQSNFPNESQSKKLTHAIMTNWYWHAKAASEAGEPLAMEIWEMLRSVIKPFGDDDDH